MAKTRRGAIRPIVVATVLAFAAMLGLRAGSSSATARAAMSASPRLYFAACIGSDGPCQFFSATEGLSDVQPVGQPQHVSRVGARSNWFSISGDGSKIVFDGPPNGKPYWPEELLDVATGALTEIGHDNGIGGLISPDGNLVLTDEPSTRRSTISIKNLITGATRTRRFVGTLPAAAWAPDSEHLWFAVNGIANNSSGGRYVNHVVEYNLRGQVQKSYLVVPEPRYGLAVDHLALDGHRGFVFFGGTVVANAGDRSLLSAFYEFTPGKHRRIRKVAPAPGFRIPPPVVDAFAQTLFTAQGKQLCRTSLTTGARHCVALSGPKGSLSVVGIATPKS
jgi:hypothetical protein